MNKRLLIYILITLAICAIVTYLGIQAAYAKRGYLAVGGEIMLPIPIFIIAEAIYNRKDHIGFIKGVLNGIGELVPLTEEKE